jgi:hypothetical protein
MDREELAQLRDAIDTVLTWPDAVRDAVAQWLTPVAAKGNGLDLHPPPAAPAETAPVAAGASPRRPPGEARRRRHKPISAATIERRLIAAMEDNSDLSERALANSAGVSRSSAGERLRRLAAEGKVAKGVGGHWRLAEEKARLPAQGKEPGPMIASPS